LLVEPDWDIDALPQGLPLSAMEVRALIAVAVDLAEDLDVECAVAVVDAQGTLLAAERAASVPGDALSAAIAAARRVVTRRRAESSAPASSAVALDARGALAVSGGPDGFALEACRSAAQALGFGRSPAR
jgi:uncharacterized protein GlcG (DUF336 family)